MAVAKPKLVTEPTDPATTEGDDVADPTPPTTPEPAAPVADDDAAGTRAVRMKDLQDIEAWADERFRKLEAREPGDDDVADPEPEPAPVAEPDASPSYDLPAPPSASRWPWLAVAALAVVAGVLFYLRRRAST